MFFKILTFLFCCFLSQSVFALLDVQGPGNISIEAWAGATGDLEGRSDFCIISSIANNPNRPRRYDVAGYSINPLSTAGEFPIKHTVSGNTLNINVDFIHASGTFPLQDYTSTGYITPLMTGAINCTVAEASVSVVLTLPAAQLAQAEAGVYTAQMGFDVLQQGNGGQYSSVIQFTVTIPKLIQLTGLPTTMAFPNVVNTDTTIVEGFCVFRNGQGGFNLQVTGLHDSATDFYLLDAVPILYKIGFATNQAGPFTDVAPGAPGLLGGVSGFTGSGTRDCADIASGQNMAIRLNVPLAEYSGKQQGTYTDTINITVSPN